MNNNNKSTGKGWEQAQVECYSGYKTNERPVAFSVQGRCWEISEILDRWYEGGIKPDAPIVDYFKVEINDGGVFILRYDAQSDVWSIWIDRDRSFP